MKTLYILLFILFFMGLDDLLDKLIIKKGSVFFPAILYCYFLYTTKNYSYILMIIISAILGMVYYSKTEFYKRTLGHKDSITQQSVIFNDLNRNRLLWFYILCYSNYLIAIYISIEKFFLEWNNIWGILSFLGMAGFLYEFYNGIQQFTITNRNIMKSAFENRIKNNTQMKALDWVFDENHPKRLNWTVLLVLTICFLLGLMVVQLIRKVFY